MARLRQDVVGLRLGIPDSSRTQWRNHRSTTDIQSKTEDFLRFWAVRCADLGFIPPPGRTALVSWPNDSSRRCYSADVGDQEIERPGQLPTDPITWFLLTVFN
jgi:hypothetical protein